MAAVGGDQVPAARRQTRQRFLPRIRSSLGLVDGIVTSGSSPCRQPRPPASPPRWWNRLHLAAEKVENFARVQNQRNVRWTPGGSSASAPAASPGPPPRGGRLSTPTGRSRARGQRAHADERRDHVRNAPSRRHAALPARLAAPIERGPALRRPAERVFPDPDRRAAAPAVSRGYRAAKIRATEPRTVPDEQIRRRSRPRAEHLLQLVDDAAAVRGMDRRRSSRTRAIVAFVRANIATGPHVVQLIDDPPSAASKTHVRRPLTHRLDVRR